MPSFLKKKKNIIFEYGLLRDFIDHIPDVIYFKDLKGRLILVNKAHAKGLRLKPEQVVGKTDFDIFGKDRAEVMSKDDRYVLKTGKPIIDKIERATRPDGIDNYVSTTKIPRFNTKGKVVGIIGVTRDVTKRMQFERLKEEKSRMKKKLEALEDLNKIKSEFISTVSHELRTPLAIIKQLLLLILDETAGSVNDRQREVLIKARNNLERLRNTIDKLLDMSRLERKKLKLRYSLVNLVDLFRDSEDFFKSLAKEKNITLAYDLPKGEISLFVDVERVVQVIVNLIDNAIKFTEENGSIRVEVKVLEAKVRVGVLDSGIGIAKDDIPKVFGRFVQVSRSDKKETKGIGLGLSITKELVEKHGGEIWVESKLGVGSKFYFTLPRFHAMSVLNKEIKNKIQHLLDQDIPVYLVNLLIVNFQEFRKRIKVDPQKLSGHLKSIIEQSFREFSKEGDLQRKIFIKDMHAGKFSIIFPATTERKFSQFCEMLKEKTKDYFVRHKIDDVFLALGMLSYMPQAQKKSLSSKRSASHISIKEIYIGSEMRRFKRIPYPAQMEMILPHSERESCKTVDISQGGICFISRKPLKTDSEIEIKLELLKNKKTIYAQARVSWIKKLDRVPGKDTDQYKVGIEFIHMDSADKRLLTEELKFYHE